MKKVKNSPDDKDKIVIEGYSRKYRLPPISSLDWSPVKIHRDNSITFQSPVKALESVRYALENLNDTLKVSQN